MFDISHNDFAHRQYTFNLDDSITPSEQFLPRLNLSALLFHLKNKAGRRVILNDFLLDVLAPPEFEKSLKAFPGIHME